MKLFEVEWKVNTKELMGLQYGASPNNKKCFTEKGKADDWYKRLLSAASLLGISGSLEAHVFEIEIE